MDLPCRLSKLSNDSTKSENNSQALMSVSQTATCNYDGLFSRRNQPQLPYVRSFLPLLDNSNEQSSSSSSNPALALFNSSSSNNHAPAESSSSSNNSNHAPTLPSSSNNHASDQLGSSNNDYSALPSSSSSQIPNNSSVVDVNYLTNALFEAKIEYDMLCSKCSFDELAIVQCLDCRNVKLCRECCVREHGSANCNTNHKIVRLTPTSTIQGTYAYCEIHNELRKYYCESCKYHICSECYLAIHTSHKVTLFSEHESNVKVYNTYLRQEIAEVTKTIQQAVLRTQEKYDLVDHSAQSAANEVLYTINNCILALQKRQAELLHSINQFRQQNINAFQTHIENLTSNLIKLTEHSFLLDNILETGSEAEVKSVNDSAVVELRRLRTLRNCFDLPEGVSVFFSLGASTAEELANVGEIVITSHGMSPRLSLNFPGPILKYAKESGRGRPIFGVNHQIIVKKGGKLARFSFGKPGNNDGELCRPWGICCDKNGYIYVSDRCNHRIQVFDQNGKFLLKFGKHGVANGEFDKPVGLTIDAQNRIIVCDKDNHRVQVFTLDGTFLFKFGENGKTNGQFMYPFGVATNSKCQIVIADSKNFRIQMFDAHGTFLKYFNSFLDNVSFKKIGPCIYSKQNEENFTQPRGICFTPAGNILVTDFTFHRIIEIDSDLEQASYFGKQGAGPNEFKRPQGIVCDDKGTALVIDGRNQRIQVIDSNTGTQLYSFGDRFGKYVMAQPTDLCLSPDGSIYAIDFVNNRVVVF